MRPWSGALAALMAAVAHGAEEKLPPRHCVVELRAARIAGQSGDAAAELAALRQAVESCPGEVEPVIALLSYGSRNQLPEGDVAALNATLLARLGPTGGELPVTVLQRIAAEPLLGAEIKSALLALVERRVETDADPAALRLLASLQLDQGNRTAAIATLERLRASDRSSNVVWALAGLYAEHGRWEELSRLLDQLEGTPDEAISLLQIEALSRAGRDLETVAALKQLAGTIQAAGRQATAAFVDQVLRAAWNLRDAQDDDAAEEMFRLALAHDPENHQAREALTFLYGSEEDRERHRAALDQKLAAETEPRALFEAGTNKLAEGDTAGAYELLARAAPALAMEAAWYNLGIAAFRLKRWSDAADALGHAAELNPARADTHFFRGHALVEAERWSDAIPVLTRALELHGDRPLAHMDLAVAYHHTGQTELAEKHRKIYESAATAENPAKTPP